MVFGVSDQVLHKPACAATEDGQELKISKEEGLYYPCSKNKGADQLCSYCEADLCISFCVGKSLFFHDADYYNVLLLLLLLLLCPPNRRWGTYCFWCGSRRRRRRRPRPRSFFLTRYLLNQWMDFDQTCIDTWLGGGKELIRFW